MKHVLKIILLIAFLSNIQTTIKAQSVIMLKDRLYDTTRFSPSFGIPSGEIYQARIIDGFIYTIEAWRTTYNPPQDFDSTWYYAKYDLNGNLIKRKKFPLNLNPYYHNSHVTSIAHDFNGSTNMFKIDDNYIGCYIPYLGMEINNLSQQYFFKFTYDLDSVSLRNFQIIRAPNNNSIYTRKAIQIRNNNFLLLSIEDGGFSFWHKLKLQKLDANLNAIWTNFYNPDTIHYLQYPVLNEYFFDGISLNEFNDKYYIALPSYNANCHFNPGRDTNCLRNKSDIDIHVYIVDNNGIQIQDDSFNLGKYYNTVQQEGDHWIPRINVSKLIFQPNGYRLILYTYDVSIQTPGMTYIIDVDTATKQVQLVDTIRQKPFSLISNPYLNKGFINFKLTNPNNVNSIQYPIFYNYNSTYSSATLNQNSVKPIPDSFYMYYPNRFQKVIDYQTTWIDENIDTSYLLLGKITLKDSGTFLSIIPLSNSFGVYNGTVYKDNNKNCASDASDSPYKNRIVEVTKTNAPVPYKYYDQTDGYGKFEIFTDTGNFSAKVYPASNLWSACPTTQTFTINNANDSVTQNFYLKKLINCPKLSVSIATNRLRPCFANTYFVNYCNKGTTDAVGATVQVLFDSAIVVNNASVSYSNIGNLYTFNVGTIKEDSCGQFSITTTLACNAIVGLTHCVTAHIYPDSLCVPANANWNRANVAVDGQCLGDSVRFRIRNIGTGNMTQPKKYYVVEDHVLRIAPQDFQLNAGQEFIVKLDANGHTIRLVADQVDNFPYPSNPTAVVENCGGLNPGFVNSFPNDDAADFIAINCTQSVASVDPNDKNGVPEGVNNQHLIAKNTDVDYKIRFQNTGTDTAYDVYILDTLSSKLNVASLQMGAASHPYRYEIYGDGQAILKVVFPNINLVDSFHNEPLSHGFFTYRIAQDSTNVEGDKILNNAAIYFDYNQPVITNTTLHTVTANFLRIISSVIENKWKATTAAYPNPFNDRCTIEIKTDKKVTGKFRFTLFDLKGQLIQEQFVEDNVELWAKDLPNNMYLYRIEKDGELVGAGKVVKE